MATQVQFRRGTTTQNNAFTGAIGEITYDTEVKTLRLHDGTNAGGGATLVNTAVAQTLANKTLSTGSIWQGNSIGLGYGGTGSSLTGVPGAVVYSGSSGFGLTLAGISGQILQSGGSGSPTWISASGLSVGTATTAVRAGNIDGGSAGYLVYQVDTNETGFIQPGLEGYVLRSTGASTAPAWVTSSVTIGSSSIVLGDTVTDFTGVTSFNITGTTDSSSSTTGAFKTAGGAGIAKNLYVGGNTVITGNLTVNGTTTTVNSTTLTVDDKNIEIGSVDTPSDTTANGGGITLKGTTDKTINWDSSNSNWTSSEHWNIASGKSFKIATVPVLTASTVLNDSTQTSITVGGYATTVSFGATTGKTTVNSTDDASSNTSGALTVAGGVSVQKKLYVGSDTVLSGDLQVKGGDITTDQTTFNLLNSIATTLNIGGAATTINVGYSTGTLTVNNAATVFNSTSNIKLPVGDISQRPGTPAAGMVRYNSEISSFEGYASGAWSSLGGVKSVDGLTYILAETSAGASNDELEFYTATDDSNTAKRGGWNKTRLLVNTPILVTSNASLTSFPNAKIISSTGVTGDSHPYNAGIVGEAVASGSDTTIWGVGVYGVGASNGGTKSAGVLGDGHVSATGDTGSAVGVRGYAVDTHAGGLNIGLFGTASGSGVGNYALYMETGNIFSNAAQTWTLLDNNSAALSLDATGKTGILKVITTDSAEGVTMSGTLGVTGDFKVNTNKFTVTASTGNTSVAGTLAVTGDQTNTGDLAVNGGDLTTTSTTATLFNTNATTLNIGGAATTINIGSAASGAATNVGKDLYVAGNLYVTGTQSTGSIATVSGADSAIYVNAGATGNTKEIGIIGEYKPAGTTLYTGILKDHTDATWKFYSAPTNNPAPGTTQSFTGATYDAVKMGALTATNGTFSAALTYGGVTLSNSVTGTGSMVLSASPTLTGHPTIEGVTSTGATGTGKFVFDASPTISGHPTIEGVTSTGATGTGAFVFSTSPTLTTPSLGVASATSINKVAITAPATSATLTLADGSTHATVGAYTSTFTFTAATGVTFPTTGTLATLAGSETLANKTLTTPNIGVATATSVNKVAITAPAASATLTIADGKTLTASNTITLTATDGSTLGIGTGGTLGTAAYTASTAYAPAAGSTSVVTLGTVTTGTWQGSAIATTYTAAKVTDVQAGTGVTVSATTGSVSVSIGQSVATGANFQINSLGVNTAGSGTAGEIRATNAITSYYSDDRLKTRSGNIQNALEKVLSLDGFHYTANETAAALGYDSSKQEVGLSAQQVQAIMPEVVVPAPIDDKYLTIHYERLVPLLVEAIKEQQKQIEELKSKLGM